MNTFTKVEPLNAAQNVKLVHRIGQAAKSFKQKQHPETGAEPTDAEVDEFIRRIEPGMIESILKAEGSSDASIRKSDKHFDASKRNDLVKTVKALALANGVKFIHRREMEEVDVHTEIEVTSDRSFTEIIDVEVVNATRGGQTFAFKYDLDEENNLSIRYATAFCRNDENFDPLIGMEESLKKFLAGHVLTTPIAHERFGQVKLTQLSVAYKEAEQIAKMILAHKASLVPEATMDQPTNIRVRSADEVEALAA